MNKLRERTTATLLIAIFMISMLTILQVPMAEAQETISITGNVDATVTKTDTLDTITFDIEIFSDNVPHGVYGVGVIIAISLDHPAFQIYYENEAINAPGGIVGWYYMEWTGTGWNGWGGVPKPIAETEFSATGILTGKLFSVTIPTAVLGEPGETYYYAIQVKTNNLGYYPVGWTWGSPVSDYAEATLPLPPPQYWFKASGGGESYCDDAAHLDHHCTLGVIGMSLEYSEGIGDWVPCKGSGTFIDHELKLKISFNIETGAIVRADNLIYFKGMANVHDIAGHEKQRDVPFRLGLVDDGYSYSNRFDVQCYGHYWHGTLEPGSEVTVWVWE